MLLICEILRVLRVLRLISLCNVLQAEAEDRQFLSSPRPEEAKKQKTEKTEGAKVPVLKELRLGLQDPASGAMVPVPVGQKLLLAARFCLEPVG